MDFDQSITWRSLADRLARTQNSRHRRMLLVVIEHGKAETAGDVDRLMATLADDPQYHFWGGGKDRGPKGREEVRAFYEGFVASGSGFFESAKPRIVVDDDNVVTESIMRGIIPGTVAQQRGYTIPDIRGHYLVTTRAVVFWPFDVDCCLIGEDSYGTSDLSDCQLVPDKDLPPAYLAMLEAVGMAVALV